MSFEQSIKEFLDFAIPTFAKATAKSSLIKLEKEILELKLSTKKVDKEEEYIDCIMCLFDSAKRDGISEDDIFKGFALKTMINKMRKWKENPDGTYSHIKD